MSDCQEQIVEELAHASRLVILTGAGMSTEAGIPDFRGPDGLYSTGRYNPDRVFDLAAFLDDPAPFYAFARDMLSVFEILSPTIYHRILAAMEQAGALQMLITQNIDPLHQQAGSRQILCVHGNFFRSHCLDCGNSLGFEDLVERLHTSEAVPRCSCGGLIKPDVVFFGEPVKYLDHAFAAAEDSDVLLVLGSSLRVFPVAQIPEVAQRVIVVNRGACDLSPSASRTILDCSIRDILLPLARRLNLTDATGEP